MPLDRTSPLPLWAQLSADLRARVEQGEFVERFPTDKELVEEYGVSRQTVRQAVSQLTQIGMIERQRGRGSTVLRTEFEQPLGSIYSLFGAVEARGVEQRSDVLELATTVDRDIAHHLGLPPDEALISLSRLRRAGETPLALDHVWLPATIAAPLLDVDFSHTGLYDELRDRCGVEIDGGSERILPVLLDDDQRRLLDLDSEAAAGFRIERSGRASGRDIEYRVSIVRGDRYGFVVDWSAASISPMRMAASP